jgi:branched-chain amino acid transport system ATP-binding protein
MSVPEQSVDAEPPAQGEAMLELRHVEASYGPFRALFGVSVRVERGKAVALLGANGAGKTTVARVASGLVAPTGGTVHVAGEDMTGKRTYLYARKGVVHAPEGRSVFATLTVSENLELAFRQSKGSGGVAAGLDEAYSLFPRLGERSGQIAGTLSGGEQRMLSLARALVERPTVLIADELSLGLAPIVVDEVYQTLRTIRDSGTSLLIVEQHVGHALAIADRVLLMAHGEVSWEGDATEAADVVAAGILGPAASH